MKRIRAPFRPVLLALLCGFLFNPATAGTLTSTLRVAVTIVNDCAVDANFRDPHANVVVDCSAGTPYSVSFHDADEPASFHRGSDQAVSAVRLRAATPMTETLRGESPRTIRIVPVVASAHPGATSHVVATIYY